MDRESLDEFFARAEDVLTDWQGSTDAMHARVPGSEDVEALPGDSYYDQPSGPVWSPWLVEWSQPSPRDVEAARRAMAQIVEAAYRAVDLVRAQMLAFGRAYFIVDEHRVLVDTPDTDVPAVRFVPFGPPRQEPAADDDPRERALALRRTRNTGPTDPYRITRRRNQRTTR